MTRIIKAVSAVVFFLPFFCQASPLTYNDCLFESVSDDVCPAAHPGSSTTGNRILNDSVTAIAGNIAEATALALRSKTVLGGNTSGARLDLDRETGMAAGDHESFVWGAWGSYSRTQSDSNVIYQMYDASLNSALFGIDLSYSNNLIYGIAFGYDGNNVHTDFNLGEQDVTSVTVAPYLGYVINENFTFDMSAGYSAIDIDQTRSAPGVSGPEEINGDTDSDRFFISGNLNGYTRYNDFVFSGRLGILYANEDKDAIVESGGSDAFTTPSQTVELGELQVGGDIAYTGWNAEPYVTVFYQYDFIYEDLKLDPGLSALYGPAENDEDDIRIGVGLRYFGDNGFSSTLEWTAIADRAQFDSHILSVILRLDL